MRAWSLVVAILAVCCFAPRALAQAGSDPVTAALLVPAARLSIAPPASAFDEVQLLPLQRLEARASRALPALPSLASARALPALEAAPGQAAAPAPPRVQAPAGTRYSWALEDNRVYWYAAGA